LFHVTALAVMVVGALAACSTTPPPEEDSPGTLVVLVSGLPAGADGAVTVTGPGSFDEQLTASDTLGALTPGIYTVSASDVSYAGISYTAAVTGTPASVASNDVVTATVSYSAASVDPGDLTVTIAGLPGGVEAAVTVTGSGVSEQLIASGTLTDIDPGVYAVTAANVNDGGDVYAATIDTSPVTVPAGGAASVTVTYSFLDPGEVGSLAVTISGLPAGTDAAVNVSGTAFDEVLTASTTLTNLTPGFYDVTGADVTADGLTYTATVVTSPVLVIPNDTANVDVQYLAVAPDDGDAQSSPGWSAQFRNTSGAPVSVSEILFNSAAPLDVKGIQLANQIGDPGDPGDWLEFRLVHGEGEVSSVEFELECESAYSGSSPIRMELRDDEGAKLGQTVTCGGSATIAIPNEGTADYLVAIIPSTSEPFYMEYVLSVDAFCFQACAYQPYDP
jgi:hypothetical protein